MGATAPAVDTQAIDTQGIARSFVDARRARTALPVYPGTKPTAMIDAYAVQDAAIAADGREIAGWKLGKIDPPVEGVNRLAGPIFTDQVVVEEEMPAMMPVFADGFGAAESEFLLRIGTAPDPAKRDYTIDEALALIDAVHVGIEIASSPFPGINDNGPLVTITDFGNNNGLVIGAPIKNWRDADIVGWPIKLLINGEVIGDATARTMLDGPFGAARFLFEHMAGRGMALRAGQWISTGAVTGVHRVAVGDEVEALFGTDHAIRCTIAAH